MGRNMIWADRRLVFIDGKKLVCSNNWIRDHVHEMKGTCHWEYDMGSFLQFILGTQRADGCYFELIKQMDDFHWKMVDPDCYRNCATSRDTRKAERSLISVTSRPTPGCVISSALPPAKFRRIFCFLRGNAAPVF